MSITDASEDDARQLELRIESVPPFVRPKLWHIDVLAPGADCRITDLDVQLDGALLTCLTEAETAIVTLSLRRRDAGPLNDCQEALASLQRTVELLPRNQWGVETSSGAAAPSSRSSCSSFDLLHGFLINASCRRLAKNDRPRADRGSSSREVP